jgi:Tol biopolymer transport system component
MAKSPERPAPNSAAESRRLDSWKEIASFLGRGIRTVQRWEREEGLPVHRLPHAERGSVFAHAHELSAWWDQRQINPGPAPQAPLPTETKARVDRVTMTAAATFWPALSSDARMVVFVSDAGQDGGAPQLWLQQIGGAAVQLTSGLHDCAEPSFFNNDTRVAFSAAGESTQNVYEIPALGGPPRVIKRAARNGRFSPDGKWLAYIALEPRETVRLAPVDGGAERTLATDLVDIASARWSDDSRHLLVIAHPNPSVDLDCWAVPVDGGSPVDTGAFRRGRQQGLIVITMPPAWAGDSIFYSAAGRQGMYVWRQRLSPALEAIGAPELMTPGGDWAYFPAASRGRLSFVGTHADINLWSIAIDAVTGKAHGPLRRLTRGSGFISNLTLSEDGRSLGYFAAGTSGGQVHVRDLESGSDKLIAADAERGFPVISADGERMACGAMVPGPPVQRPVLIASVATGAMRLVREDCGGRPRQWLDERTLVVETFGAGLNAFVALDTGDGSQRPLLSSKTRRLANPRVSPDRRWLAFDASIPGGSPVVAIARMDGGTAVDESEWVPVAPAASHPFWSRDGRLLYYLPATPSTDIRNQIAAHRFDPASGRVDGEAFPVLSLTEMIVPAMVTGVAPIAAPDQIVFVLGNFRGDIWIRDV